MRPSDEGAVRPVIASNGVYFLQMYFLSVHVSEPYKAVLQTYHLTNFFLSDRKKWIPISTDGSVT